VPPVPTWTPTPTATGLRGPTPTNTPDAKLTFVPGVAPSLIVAP
jgi:hypothetical protein